MTHRAIDVPPSRRAPTARPPAVRPAAPCPPGGGAAGVSAPVSPTPQGETGDGRLAGSLHVECTLPAGLLRAALLMPEDRGDDNVEAHLRAYCGTKRDPGYGLDLAYHPWKTHAQRAREGFPDWTVAGPGGLLFLELKTQTGKPSPMQERWLTTLRAGRVHADVYRPCCVYSGRMSHDLAVIAWRGGSQ